MMYIKCEALFWGLFSIAHASNPYISVQIFTDLINSSGSLTPLDFPIVDKCCATHHKLHVTVCISLYIFGEFIDIL